MYMIQCPEGHPFPVPAKAAGSVTPCPTCGANQAVPKLGELRKLPLADVGAPVKRKNSLGMGAKIVFAVLLLTAIATGLTSAFAAFRWQNLPIPFTQAEHIAEESKALEQFTAVQLVGAWEQIETFGLGEQVPFPYHRLQNVRDHWKQVCLTSLAITGGCVLLALVVIGFARTPPPGADT